MPSRGSLYSSHWSHLVVFREGQDNCWESWKDFNNRQLLWHGSRLTNWVGILSQGLRIAPPEAPVTGYMFGKGVYFADICSKSANYWYTSHSNSNTHFLVTQATRVQW